MPKLSLSRRRFLSALGTGAASLPLITVPQFLSADQSQLAGGKILLLIELAGGNDGLNTVVPHTDPAYRGLRPQIGLAVQDLLGLDTDTGLHGSMRGVADLWEAGDVQIIEGVGYPNPNRSHFRSIEIWNAGRGADSTVRDGWVSQAFAGQPSLMPDADGLVLGGDMGPMVGPGRFSAMRDVNQFLETIEYVPGVPHAVRPTEVVSPLEHVLATYDSAHITGDVIRRKLESSSARNWPFPETSLGGQLRTAARLLDAGVEVPVLKVVQDGYDTHDGQPFEHEVLLRDLSEAISAFTSAAREMGLWQDITIVTYSEFGRTARENASAGTDHGTAAPVFVIGGQVQGGFSGGRPSLDQLVDGDLAHTTDYRALYAAIQRDLWGLTTDGMDAANLRLLG